MSTIKECPVCYEVIASTNSCITSCGHAFCLSCMLRCIQNNNSCPCCRTILIENIYDDDDDDDDDEDEDDDEYNEVDNDNTNINAEVINVLETVYEPASEICSICCCCRQCQQKVVDIDVDWLISMCRR